MGLQPKKITRNDLGQVLTVNDEQVLVAKVHSITLDGLTRKEVSTLARRVSPETIIGIFIKNDLIPVSQRTYKYDGPTAYYNCERTPAEYEELNAQLQRFKM